MLIRVLVILLTLAYPFAVYWGLQRVEPQLLIIPLVVLLALRCLGSRQRFDRLAVAVGILGVLAVTLLWNAHLGLKVYPVLVNLGLLAVFASSLWAKQSIIERLARLKEPDLPPSGVRYTRKVTLAWCLFFTLNASVSTSTALWASDAAWMLYNGLISYLAIGIMFAGEWLVRQRVRKSS
ncbi:hypothetical protein ACKC9G_09895 [Pokkaliibacter sp. CJK22405]|uniref:COG4648 family protein n=1 Tax=Pokkaliibacter sp. CJK22405 TaxID=3384615 RepID=UPI0039854BBB